MRQAALCIELSRCLKLTLGSSLHPPLHCSLECHAQTLAGNIAGLEQHLKQMRRVQLLTAGAFLFCCLLLPAAVSAVVDLSRVGEDVAPAPMVAPDKPAREPVMRESSLGPVVCKLLPEVMSLRGTRPSEWTGHAEPPSPATPLVPEGCANTWRSWCISGPQEEGRCRPKLVGMWRAVRMAVTGG